MRIENEDFKKTVKQELERLKNKKSYDQTFINNLMDAAEEADKFFAENPDLDDEVIGENKIKE